MGERRRPMKKKLVLIALVTLTTLPLAGFAGAFEVDLFISGADASRRGSETLESRARRAT